MNWFFWGFFFPKQEHLHVKGLLGNHLYVDSKQQYTDLGGLEAFSRGISKLKKNQITFKPKEMSLQNIDVNTLEYKYWQKGKSRNHHLRALVLVRAWILVLSIITY